VARQMNLTSAGFQVETEITIKSFRKGFRIVEVPVDLRPRPWGSRSKLRPLRDGLAILGLMWRLPGRLGRRRPGRSPGLAGQRTVRLKADTTYVPKTTEADTTY